MLTPFSQVELALRDTLLHKAESWIQDAIAELYGVVRPPTLSRDDWRQVLRAVCYGHRGTLGTTWAMLELAFRGSRRTISGTIDSANPHEFERDGSAADNPEITCLWPGRLVRLRYSLQEPTGDWRSVSKILYTANSGSIPAIGPYPSTLAFAEIATGHWTSEDCSDPLIGTGVSATAATVELLPWFLREPQPGPRGSVIGSHPLDELGNPIPVEWLPSLGTEAIVEVLLEAALFTVPPTYLLDPGGVDRDTVDPLMPDGGIIMDLFGAINGTPGLVEAGNQDTGPYPVYWIDETDRTGFARYFDPILAAGVDFDAQVVDFCNG
jgi:hypothetical protein